MKKIILALTVFSLLFSVQVLAATYTKSVTKAQMVSSKLNQTYNVKAKAVSFDRDCVKKSLAVRSEGVIKALSVKHDTIGMAMKERYSTIMEAYDLKTAAEITATIAKAQANFKAVETKANLTYQRDVKALWLKYNTGIKLCKGNAVKPGEPTIGGLIKDLAQ